MIDSGNDYGGDGEMATTDGEMMNDILKKVFPIQHTKKGVVSDEMSSIGEGR